MIPKIKVSQIEEEEGLSETKADLIKMTNRKRRRYANSFYNAENII